MQILLSISVLISDRPATVERCLKSLVPILQQIPSELIIVYTGHSEGCLEIAHKYTDRIIPFKWCDDFSKARNAGLAEAAGEWFMYIDDDEWFEDCTELVDFFKYNDYKDYMTACYVQKNYFDIEGKCYSDFMAPRMAKRTADVKFTGIVHEALTPWTEPVKYLGCFVHHYGYAEKNDDRETESYNRNIPLLEKDIKQNPGNIRQYVQLAQELYRGKEFEKAEVCCRKILKLSEDGKTNNYFHWAMVLIVETMVARKRMDAVIEEGERFIATSQISEMYTMFLYIFMVPAYFSMNQYAQCVSLAKKFTALRRTLDADPDMWNRQQLADINRTNTLNRSDHVYTNAILAAFWLGEFQEAQCFVKEFDWKSEYRQAERYHFCETWKKIFRSDMEQILLAFYKVDSDNSYVLFQKALYCEFIGDLAQTEQFYAACQRAADSTVIHQIMFLGIRNNFKVPEFFLSMDLDDWKNCAQRIADSFVFGDYAADMNRFTKYFSDYPVHRMYLQQKILSRYLFTGGLDDACFLDSLCDYCKTVIEVNRMLYRDELFHKSMQFCLPKECRIAIELQEAFTLMHDGQMEVCITNLKQLLHKYPDTAYIIRRVSDYIGNVYAAGLPGNVNTEFYTIGQKIKSVMRKLADDEKYDEALSVAEELGALLPEDVEVIKYKQLLRGMLKRE